MDEKDENLDVQANLEDLKASLSALQAPEVLFDSESKHAVLRWQCVESTVTDEDGYCVVSQDVEYQLKLQEGQEKKTVYDGKDTTYTLTDLLPGHKYRFSVVARSKDVWGDEGPEEILEVPPERPSQPAVPKVVNRSKSNLTVRWNPPQDNGAAVQSYSLEWDQCKGEFLELYSGKEKQFRFTHKFQPTSVAKFRIRASNSVGWSDYSEPVVCEARASAPLAPSAPKLVEAGVTTIQLCWEEPGCQGSAISSYTLQMEDPTSGYGFQPVYQGEELSYTCSGLQRATTYSFRVAATNDRGIGPFSSPPAIFSTVPDVPGPPGEPCLSKKARSSILSLCWEPPQDMGGSDVHTYILQMSDGDGKFDEVYCGPDMAYAVDALSPGREYLYRVCGVSAGGQGVWSPVARLSTLATLPMAPRNLQPHGKSSSTQVSLKWEVPISDGGAPVISYSIEEKQAAKSAWSVVLTVADPATFKGGEEKVFLDHSLTGLLTNLLPGSTYHFRVFCTNSVGNSEPSMECVCKTAAGPPDPPTGITVANASASSAVLSWQPGPEHGTPPNGFLLEYWEESNKEESKKTAPVVSGSHLKVTLRGLLPATKYSCHARALSSAGPSCWSKEYHFVTSPSPPDCPKHLNAVCITSDSAQLVWACPDSHGSPVTGYNVEVSGKEITQCPSTETQYKLDGLQPDTTYKVRVQAVNVVGKGQFCGYVTVSTLPLPPTPPTITLISCTSNTLKLSWGGTTCRKNSSRSRPVSTTAADSYVLQMGTRQQASNFRTIHHGPGSTHKTAKLQPDTSYSFRVAACSKGGQGEWSEIVVYRTLPPSSPVPTGLSLRLSSTAQCLLSWGKVSPSEGVVYEAQVKTTPTGGYQKVYLGAETSVLIPAPSPGHVLEGKVRSCTKVTVNGKSETLWSNYSFPVAYQSPEPQDAELPKEIDEKLVGSDASKLPAKKVTKQNSQWKISDIKPPYISLMFLMLVVILGGLLSVIIGHFM